ncbi:hypothetical protein MD484_g8144, partial [Candolleomyces efflorescens]
MIDKVGLIHKGNEMQIPFAYALYMDPTSDTEQAAAVGSLHQNKQLGLSKAKRFKRAFSREVKVHFVGAWDTVSSLGPKRRKNMPPRTTTGMMHVCFFRHALALDERRVKFLPEYANGGSSPHKHLTQVDGSEITYPHTVEVWFAGTHSDIGGGNTYNAQMNRSRPPLRWMVEQAKTFGLRTAAIPDEHEQLNELERIDVKESLNFFWSICEILPFRRLTFNASPTARPEEATRWYQLASANFEDESEQMEMKTEIAKANLRAIVLGPDGPQVLYDAIFKAMEELEKIERYSAVVKSRVLAYTLGIVMEILQEKLLCIKMRPSPQMPGSLAGPLTRVKDRLVVKQYLQNFTDHFSLHQLHGHTAAVTSLAISSNGERIVSGSEDRTVRVWDMKTGNLVAEPLVEHADSVTCVAISPDGGWVVSGSRDRTVRVWDANSGTMKTRSLRGHTDTVTCVAIWGDGDAEYVASGSADNTVRIWDVESATQLACLALRYPDRVRVVGSFAMASTGNERCFASGSRDGDSKCVVWDVQTGTVVAEHSDSVTSNAFLPDGRIVSNSRGGPIRLQGTDAVFGQDRATSALASDGKHIFSGCEDGKIWMWDIETGKVGNIMLHNHTDVVTAIAISPNGERIISGSRDKSIWIWDAKTIMRLAHRKIKDPLT